jgi:aminoglycoside/choline kinase family phosphotransferase
MLAIPKQPEDLTAEWLSEALGVTVVTLAAEPIAAGVGFLGKLARLTPRYAGAAAGAPRSLIAKLPTLDPGTRQLARLFRFYEREVRFYREVSSRVGVRVPKLLHGDFDAESGDFVLLLEDMAPARVGDQLESCTPEQARVAVREAAALHATWWRKPELDALTWMPFANDPVHLSAEPTYQACWPGFLKFTEGKLSDPVKRIGERLGARVNRIQHVMMERPVTLVHGDYRLDNLFFAAPQPAGGGGVLFAAVDWQIAFRGNGTFDVGYLLAGNLTVAGRRAQEQELLRLYHDRLVSGGVNNYDFASCLRDYKLSALFCLVYVVISIATLDPANARGVALFQAWLERVGTAILDLEAEQVMPD